MIGRRLSRDMVMESIGSDEMGVVYRAHDEHLERDVARKVLPAGALADDESRRRFRVERILRQALNDLHGESKGAAEAMAAQAAVLRKSGRAEEAAPLEARARELLVRVGSGPGASDFMPGSRPLEERKGSAAR